MEAANCGQSERQKEWTGVPAGHAGGWMSARERKGV
jgi:hypothetical protein